MKKKSYKYSLVTSLASACALSLLAPMALAQSKDQVVEGDDGEKVYFEEVIVSAERREANVMDTAMSISAFSADMMTQLGINDRDKLQNLVPGLQFGDTGDQEGNGTTIRGVGTSVGGIEHRDRSVATYVDGAYTIGVYGTAPGGGFDLERVEVARGPQGTLNGRNAIAGSINYVYKKPSQKWDLAIEGEVTDVSQQRLNMAVGGPITDNVSFRVTTGLHTGDGRQENVGIGDDHDKPDHKFFAGQLRFQNDRFDTNLRYSKVRDTGVPRSRVQMGNVNRTDAEVASLGDSTLGNNFPDVGDLSANDYETNYAYLYETPTPSGDANCPEGVPFFRCGDVENKVALNYTGYQDSSAENINFYAQYELSDSMSLRYTYNDSDTEQLNVKDGDYMNRYADPDGDQAIATDGGVPLRDRFYSLPYDYEESSHEIMLTADVNDDLSIIAGLFYYENDSVYGITRNESSFAQRYGTADDYVTAAGPNPWWAFAGQIDTCQDFVEKLVGGSYGLPISPEDDAYYYECSPGDERTALVEYRTAIEQSSQAVFLNGDYKINESWAVSAGLRYLEDEKLQRADAQSGSATFSFGGVPLMIGYSDGGYDKPHTWYGTIGQATLEYTTESENLIYGRVSSGHKAGQFNLITPGSTGIDPIVDETTMLNYEAGLKGLFLDGRLQLNTAVFFQQYEGFHLSGFQPSGGTNGPQATSPYPEFTDNVDGTEIWGVEVEYAYAFNDTTRVMGFYAYQDSEVGKHSSVVPGDPDNQYALHEHLDEDSGGVVESWYALPRDQGGNQLPSQPKHKFAATLIHDMELASGGALSWVGTYSYTDTMYPTIANIDLYEIPSTDRWDASVRWTSPSEDYSATLYVNNILDEIGLNEFVSQTGIGDQVFLGMPTNHREFGVKFTYRPTF